MLSFTEENYIKAIYKLSTKKAALVNTNSLADKLDTKAASVTDMLKKLSAKKLINYKKYQGVVLTKGGERVALSIIRKHRLWEVFLVNTLKFQWDEIHDIAEQLEHIQSEELINRMDKFLNYPKFDPHGDPIPDCQGKYSEQDSVLLSNAKINSKYIITGVINHSNSFLAHLNQLKISLGSELKIIKTVEFDNSVEISLNKQIIYLSNEVAKNILVMKK